MALAAGLLLPAVSGAQSPRAAVIDLWAEGGTAFGIFLPSDVQPRSSDGERLPPRYSADGAERLARLGIFDFLFLNLEQGYQHEVVRDVATGVGRVAPEARPALLVRIPPLDRAVSRFTRDRIETVVASGADGIVFPHVRNAVEADELVAMVQATSADVWSPSSPDGRFIVMLMVEDPEAVAARELIAEIGGYSLLACGIGSLTAALDGDRTAAEAGARSVLATAEASRRPSMMTANATTLEERLAAGYRALLFRLDDETPGLIERGRALAPPSR